MRKGKKRENSPELLLDQEHYLWLQGELEQDRLLRQELKRLRTQEQNDETLRRTNELNRKAFWSFRARMWRARDMGLDYQFALNGAELVAVRVLRGRSDVGRESQLSVGLIPNRSGRLKQLWGRWVSKCDGRALVPESTREPVYDPIVGDVAQAKTDALANATNSPVLTFFIVAWYRLLRAAAPLACWWIAIAKWARVLSTHLLPKSVRNFVAWMRSY